PTCHLIYCFFHINPPFVPYVSDFYNIHYNDISLYHYTQKCLNKKVTGELNQNLPRLFKTFIYVKYIFRLQQSQYISVYSCVLFLLLLSISLFFFFLFFFFFSYIRFSLFYLCFVW